VKLFQYLAESGYDSQNVADYCRTKLDYRINSDGIRRWKRGARSMPLRIATGLFELVKKGHRGRTLEEALKP
jgi:hypothetical protein